MGGVDELFIASWLNDHRGLVRNGTGTVSITAAANTGAARTGTVTIAGQPFIVSQAAYPCATRTSGPSASAARRRRSGGVYTVTGAGADVWGTADALHTRTDR